MNAYDLLRTTTLALMIYVLALTGNADHIHILLTIGFTLAAGIALGHYIYRLQHQHTLTALAKLQQETLKLEQETQQHLLALAQLQHEQEEKDKLP